MENVLPPIPAKRYFTIGEVGDLCGVKPHVLRYWEQEFTQLKPMKRRGNRRYYQHHEVLMIRRIRDLLYEQGFTISGARNKLQEMVQAERDRRRPTEDTPAPEPVSAMASASTLAQTASVANAQPHAAESVFGGVVDLSTDALSLLRRELLDIRQLLTLTSEVSA